MNAQIENAYPMVPLGRIVSSVERREAPIPGKTYRQVGVRLWGEGVYEREPVDGGQTKYKTLSRVEADDIIVNKIWARNGSVGVVSESLAGSYGSNEFPTFEPIREKLDSRWVHWLTKTKGFWAQCDEKSRGTSGKNRIRPERFLQIEIPLPPLPEQQRIVARIEELAARIEEARGLRRQAVEEGEALRRAMIFGSVQKKSSPTKMRDLVNLRQPDVSVLPHETYHFAGVYSFGRGVFRGDIKTGMEFAYPRLTRISAGNFVYPKLMAWEGALGVVPQECDGLVVSPEFPVFELDQNKVLPETLDVYFRTSSVWPQLSGTSTGTNVRRRRLNPKTFLEYEFPLPPMPAQRQLREITNKLRPLREIQADTAAELDALLPSVLDLAFKGKL